MNFLLKKQQMASNTKILVPVTYVSDASVPDTYVTSTFPQNLEWKKGVQSTTIIFRQIFYSDKNCFAERAFTQARTAFQHLLGVFTRLGPPYIRRWKRCSDNLNSKCSAKRKTCARFTAERNKCDNSNQFLPNE